MLGTILMKPAHWSVAEKASASAEDRQAGPSYQPSRDVCGDPCAVGAWARFVGAGISVAARKQFRWVASTGKR